jgi:hypothetical protein
MTDIETVEWYFGSSLKVKEVSRAWERIKKSLQTSSNSNYTKLPSLIDVRDECLNDIPHEDYVIIVYNAIKKLGNFT